MKSRRQEIRCRQHNPCLSNITVIDFLTTPPMYCAQLVAGHPLPAARMMAYFHERPAAGDPSSAAYSPSSQEHHAYYPRNRNHVSCRAGGWTSATGTKQVGYVETPPFFSRVELKVNFLSHSHDLFLILFLLHPSKPLYCRLAKLSPTAG